MEMAACSRDGHLHFLFHLLYVNALCAKILVNGQECGMLRWKPKMKRVFGQESAGIYILDMNQERIKQ